jgi:hypothetical protein
MTYLEELLVKATLTNHLAANIRRRHDRKYFRWPFKEENLMCSTGGGGPPFINAYLKLKL